VQRESLSVVVPAYNEELRLPALLNRLDADMDRILGETSLRLVEVIVVDDGSTDATARIAETHPGLPGRLRVIRLDRNRGKGAAVRAGMLAAAGGCALVTDADMSTPLEDVVALSAELERGRDLVIGSRALPASQVLVHQPAYRELMGKGFNVLLRLLTGLPWRDTQCGFKLFRLETTRRLFELQQIDGFAFDAELCLLADRLGLAVAEVPVRWTNDPHTHVALVRSSLQMAIDLLRLARRARAYPRVVARATT
jgi:dolichyl-phosphate beta-glucosyltransferase